MNEAHVDIVRLGKDAIDDWRRVNLGELLDLRGANLRGADLRGADLRGANLRGANLYGADLLEANLLEADLSKADLLEASLSGAILCDCNLDGARISYRGEIVRIRFKVESANFADYANGGGGQ